MSEKAGEAIRVVVVGHGMAGGRLVDDLLARGLTERGTGRPLDVTVVGGEPYGAYNRVLLSDVLAGRADVAALSLADAAGLRARGVDIRLGTHALAIELGVRPRVTLDDGAALAFDRLVLATGAAPFVPPIAGLHPDRLPAGVHTFRTIDDCREIVATTANARAAIVLGGGLLGLEAARGLARRGLDVTVLHAAPHLLERQLDAAGGAVLARSLRRLGVRVLTGASTQALQVGGATDGSPGHVRGAVLADGRELETDLFVVACGVTSRVGLATRAGLAVGRGVIVDGALATSDPRVLAIGDCAEFDGEVAGLVAPGWDQARIAADLLTMTDPAARYRGHRPSVRLKAADVDVAAAGEISVDPWTEEEGLDIVQLLDPSRGRYVKAVVRDGIVVGAVAVGDARAAAELALMVERRAAAPLDRTALLVPGIRRGAPVTDDPTMVPDRATICRCNGVTKGAIVRAWRAGARSADDLATRTRAGTGCGTCRDAVGGILDWLAAADPDTPDETTPLSGSPNPATATPTSPTRPTGTPVRTGGTR